jgi:hypothetical protein
MRLTSHSKGLLFIDQIRDLRLWLRLGCGEMRRRVIQTVYRRAIRTRNQMAIGVDRDLDRRVSDGLKRFCDLIFVFRVNRSVWSVSR